MTLKKTSTVFRSVLSHLLLVGFLFYSFSLQASETHSPDEISNATNSQSQIGGDCISPAERCNVYAAQWSSTNITITFIDHATSGSVYPKWDCEHQRSGENFTRNFELRTSELDDPSNICESGCPDHGEYGFEEYFDSSVAPEFQCVSDCEYEISHAVNLGTNINGSEPDVLVSYLSSGETCENGDYNSGTDNSVPIENQDVGTTFEADPEIDFAFDPADTNCGVFNGENVCLDSVPNQGCLSTSDGTVLCDDSANSPPIPDTGVPQQDAEPTFTITNNTTNETTNVYNQTTVNNSTTTAPDNNTGDSDQAQYCNDNPNAAVCDSSGTPSVVSGEVSVDESGTPSSYSTDATQSISDSFGTITDQLSQTGDNPFGVQTDQTLKNSILNNFSSVTCNEVNLGSYTHGSGHTVTFESKDYCTKLQPMRNILGFFLWIGMLYTLFYLMFKSPES